MERISRLIPEIVAPFKALVVLALILSVILVAQVGIQFLIKDSTTVWEGTCSFKEWREGEYLGMIVDCGEHGVDTLTDVSFLKSYLDNPGPLMCKQSATNSIGCEKRPTLEGEDG
jgi:hypothetical protein